MRKIGDKNATNMMLQRKTGITKGREKIFFYFKT